MTTISKDAKLITLINVFTVEPANQRQLVELLAQATETSVRHAPGFVSASLHRSLDGTRVTMYAQNGGRSRTMSHAQEPGSCALPATGARPRQV